MLWRYFVANDNVIVVDGLGFMRPRLKQSNYKKCFNKKFFSMNFCLGMHSWNFQLPPPSSRCTLAALFFSFWLNRRKRNKMVQTDITLITAGRMKNGKNQTCLSLSRSHTHTHSLSLSSLTLSSFRAEKQQNSSSTTPGKTTRSATNIFFSPSSFIPHFLKSWFFRQKNQPGIEPLTPDRFLMIPLLRVIDFPAIITNLADSEMLKINSLNFLVISDFDFYLSDSYLFWCKQLY